MKTYYKVIIGLAVLVIIGTGLWLYSRYREIKTSVFETRKTDIVAYVRNRASTLIKARNFSDKDTLRQQRVFESFFETIQSPQIFRIKVFNREPKIVWSNLKGIIGQDASTNQEAIDALKEGKITWKFKSAKPEQLSERQFQEFTETYIPIPDAKGEIVGVIEVYQTAFSAIEQAKRDFQKSAIPAIVIALIGYSVMALALRFLIKAV